MNLEANMTAHSWPEIMGYDIVEQLYLGSRTAVYRAVQTAQQRPVVIKVMRHEYPSFGELVQFRNQYAITKHLPSSGIVHPLSLEPLGSGYALVMEDWGGVALSNYLQQQSLDLIDILAIALQVADILQTLNQHQVVHKDIKPANILIHPESKQVKLIDFSIASLLPKETQEIQSPNVLEGTLAYLAPEQTGRMNRGIDYRADFYALGVTLYQLLSGRLPFTSDDPLELVHCHIAKLPTPVDQINPSIPEVVAEIVAKLMAKNAEDRYQSAIGLKHDLQQCLTQWQETGEILAFELGQRDISDRFLIPEKLYGREKEVQTLLDAFDRVASPSENRVSQGSSELMLVAGSSGIGKTAIVNEVHKPITRQNGYFIKGKFDQLNRNIPLSAFVQAFRDLVGQLLSESDTQLQTWKAHILNALGDNGQVIIAVIPELERIIGSQPPATELSGTAAQNRFNLLLQKFIQVFTTAGHPLVLFLDDLQWADLASLQLLKLLIEDNGHLLIIGAYRDNEVSPIHPFIAMAEELKKDRKATQKITLKPLSFRDTNALIADALHCPFDLATPLTKLVYRKTQGNPFFTTQFLRTLHEDGQIYFDQNQRYWICDIAQVDALTLTDDVVEFMAAKLQKLPPETQAVLKLAACVGNQFDLSTLAIISEQETQQVATVLWPALQEGLVIPNSRMYQFFRAYQAESSGEAPTINLTYCFLHDRVQQAAYSLIPDQQKQDIHYHIGQLLRTSITDAALDTQIFKLVGQLNAGIERIENPSERQDLARLNLMAGYKAHASAAYDAAFRYCNVGMSLLQSSAWETNYSFTLELYELAAESSFLCGNSECLEAYSEVILSHARSPLDRLRINEIRIQAYTVQNHLTKALDAAKQALQELGVVFPTTISPEDIQQDLHSLQSRLMTLTLVQVEALPKMTDPVSLAVMRLLKSIVATAYIADPNLFPLIVFRMVQWSLEYGNSPDSPFAYAGYGILLVNLANDTKTVSEIGELALKLLKESSDREIEAKTKLIVGAHLYHWKFHANKGLPLAQASYQIALDAGDLEYAGYSAQIICLKRYFLGNSLTELELDVQAYCQDLAKLNQVTTLRYCQIYWQALLNLLGKTEDPTELTGEAFNQQDSVPRMLEASDWTGLFHFYCNQLILYYWFGNTAAAVNAASQAKPHENSLAGMFIIPTYYFYASLALLKDQTASSSTPELQQAISNLSRLKVWAESSPCNYQHRFDLVEAEYYRVIGQPYQAMERYDRAIAGAKTNDFIQEEALANELAAKFYLDWGKEKVAAGYMQEAYYCYARWGAKAKTDDLETRYPQLLQPMLQVAAQPLSVLETLASIAAPNLSLHLPTHPSRSSSSSVNTVFDFAAILKASQSLAGTIQLDELLQQLTQIILQNSGGDRCALILPNLDQEWSVVAIATSTATELCSEPLEGNTKLPVKLIQYVKNTQEIVIIDEGKTELPVMGQYLSQVEPSSVLCLPILNQAQFLGILYLENRTTSGVFTNDQLLVLNFLCTQAATSLENARLYQQAQTYSQQLEQSQLQIVQSEKMASLGNLVAGVAHEINNPIGFLNGSINNAKDYVKDLLEHLDIYQQHHPSPAAPVQDHAEDIDLEFLRDDLPKLLASMKGATDRIKSISTSLRTFSRADTEYKVSANLHDGIDSTLLILKYRLKANEFRPAIKVVRDYGEIPTIHCFPGQLNQVFMNILANAIDMFDELAQQSAFVDLQANSQILTIQTAIAGKNTIEIGIHDNGKGISDDVKSRIFDHLFTTKGVGKGTGLGLAIARQIVVDSHHGTLDVDSQVGEGTRFLIRLPISVQ